MQQDALYPAGLLRASRFVRGQAAGLFCQRIRYEQEQGENAKKIKALRLELKKDESKRMDIDDFLETVRRYTDATTITKRMVAELIDHIEVYHAEKQDGVTNQRVVIHYNCIGAFDVPDRRKIPEADIIMETRKGVALSYAPEQVAV